MIKTTKSESNSQRIQELLSVYSAPTASMAQLLCDRHSSEAIAYKIVLPDLTSENLTYGDLKTDSERLAQSLNASGLQPGDRIATLMGKSRDYLVTLMAIWRLGAVHVPLFTAFAPPAIAVRLNSSGCKLVFCDASQRPKLEPSEDIPANPPWQIVSYGTDHAEDLQFDQLLASGEANFPAVALGGNAPIIQIYTSGTTGAPKGVIIPLRALAAFHAYAEFALDLRPDDTFWNAADPGWAYGLYYGVITTFVTGVRSIFYQGSFEAQTIYALLEKYGVSNFAAAPTVYRSLRMAKLGDALALTLRCASSAGEPLTPEINEWARETLGVTVFDHYGQTETGMLINNHHHPSASAQVKPGSMGLPMPGWKAVVLHAERDEIAELGKVGRLAIDITESPLSYFNGYADNPEKSAERFSKNGRWYLTGDVARQDEEGYFHFYSRDDDVIIMAGYRIGPFDVESVLAAHPAVSESAAIATPDETRGEVLEAVVVLREGWAASEALTLELQNWVKKKFAAHAYPRKVHYVELLPKTPSGKTQRFLLRKQYS